MHVANLRELVPQMSVRWQAKAFRKDLNLMNVRYRFHVCFIKAKSKRKTKQTIEYEYWNTAESADPCFKGNGVRWETIHCVAVGYVEPCSKYDCGPWFWNWWRPGYRLWTLMCSQQSGWWYGAAFGVAFWWHAKLSSLLQLIQIARFETFGHRAKQSRLRCHSVKVITASTKLTMIYDHRRLDVVRGLGHAGSEGLSYLEGPIRLGCSCVSISITDKFECYSTRYQT